MKVDTILQAKGAAVETTRPDAPLRTVVRRLKLRGIGALVASEDGLAVLGTISERDIVHGLAAHGPDLLDMRVEDLMTRAPITCGPDDDIRTVMAEMTRRRVRHIPVVENGHLCGIISIGDVIKNRLDEVETEASVLRDAYIARH